MARLRSPLMRRLRKHTRMATIQRAALGVNHAYPGSRIIPAHTFPQTSEPTAAKGFEPISRAIILPPHNDLPMGQISPPLPEGFSREAQQVLRLQRASQLQTDISHPTHPQATETPTTALPETQIQPPDKGWNLLQTIFRKHQEKKVTAENGPIQRQDPPAGAESETSANQNIPVDSAPSGTIESPGSSSGSGMETDSSSATSPGDSKIPEARATESGSAQTEGNKALGGNLTVGGSATIGGSATVGGNASIGGPAIIGGNAAVGGNVSAGSNLSAGGNLESAGNASAGANIAASVANVAGNLQAGADMNTGAAKTGGNIEVGGNLTTGSAIKTGGEVNVGGNVTAGGPIESQGSPTIGGDAISGGNIQASGDVDIGGSATQNIIKGAGNVEVGANATIGAFLQAGSEVEIGGSAQVGGAAKAGGELSVGGSLTIGGNASVGGSINAGGPVTIGGTSNVSPGGAAYDAVQPKRVDEPLPLQDAWPVQRKPEFLPETPSVMRSANPGQVSDSPIEIIPPRRPRPLDAPTLIQRAIPPQKEAKSQFQQIRSGEEVSVPTEIGPLPQDLWRLIGQQPPQQESAPGSPIHPIVSRTPEKKRSAPKVETPQPRSGDSPKISESFIAPPAPFIQRAEIEGEAASQESGSDEQAPELDTDELARKVYAEIKHRLTTEWERFRNLF